MRVGVRVGVRVAVAGTIVTAGSPNAGAPNAATAGAGAAGSGSGPLHAARQAGPISRAGSSNTTTFKGICRKKATRRDFFARPNVIFLCKALTISRRRPKHRDANSLFLHAPCNCGKPNVLYAFVHLSVNQQSSLTIRIVSIYWCGSHARLLQPVYWTPLEEAGASPCTDSAFGITTST